MLALCQHCGIDAGTFALSFPTWEAKRRIILMNPWVSQMCAQDYQYMNLWGICVPERLVIIIATTATLLSTASGHIES